MHVLVNFPLLPGLLEHVMGSLLNLFSSKYKTPHQMCLWKTWFPCSCKKFDISQRTDTVCLIQLCNSSCQKSPPEGAHARQKEGNTPSRRWLVFLPNLVQILPTPPPILRIRDMASDSLSGLSSHRILGVVWCLLYWLGKIQVLSLHRRLCW